MFDYQLFVIFYLLLIFLTFIFYYSENICLGNELNLFLVFLLINN